MDIFSPIVKVFDFIYGLLQTVIDGVKGITYLIYSIVRLINNILQVLPTPLYIISLSYIGLFSTILIYKLFRKG